MIKARIVSESNKSCKSEKCKKRDLNESLWLFIEDFDEEGNVIEENATAWAIREDELLPILECIKGHLAGDWSKRIKTEKDEELLNQIFKSEKQHAKCK